MQILEVSVKSCVVAIALFGAVACNLNSSSKDEAKLEYMKIRYSLDDEPLHLQGPFGLDLDWCVALNGIENYAEIVKCYNQHPISGGKRELWHRNSSVSKMDDTISFSSLTISSPYSLIKNDYRTDVFSISCDRNGWFVGWFANEGLESVQARIRVDKKKPFDSKSWYEKQFPPELLSQLSGGQIMLMEYVFEDDYRISTFDISGIDSEISLLRTKCGLQK